MAYVDDTGGLSVPFLRSRKDLEVEKRRSEEGARRGNLEGEGNPARSYKEDETKC